MDDAEMVGVTNNPKSQAPDQALLANLLNDTSGPALMMLAERYGLKGVWHHSREALVEHLLNDSPPETQAQIVEELIAARFAGLSVAELLLEVIATAATCGICFVRAVASPACTNEIAFGASVTAMGMSSPRYRYVPSSFHRRGGFSSFVRSRSPITREDHLCRFGDHVSPYR
jgi:hypothetical protein